MTLQTTMTLHSGFTVKVFKTVVVYQISMTENFYGTVLGIRLYNKNLSLPKENK